MMKDKMPGYYKYQVDEDEEPLLDEDVSNEQKRVSTNFDTFHDVLKVFGLKKKFRKKGVLLLYGLCKAKKEHFGCSDIK